MLNRPASRLPLGRDRHPTFPALLAAASTCVLLAGCASFSVPGADMALPTKYASSTSSRPADNTTTAWWLSFRDQRLNALIERGLGQNLSIAQAVERINEANAGMISAGASVVPTTSGTGSARVAQEGTSSPATSASYSGNVSWVLDLFGQYKNERIAASASLDAAYRSADTARLTFLSEVASAYIDMRYYQETLALTRSSLATRRETLELTKTLEASGAGSQLDVLQAQSALDSASLQLPSLELGFIRSVNRLATLTAQSASEIERDLQKGAPQPWPRTKVNAGIPADVVRQRPDIQAAERNLTAAGARAGVAEAQMYPSITLSGNIQLSQAAGWSFGPTVNLPFLDGGRAKGSFKAAESQANQAYLSWQVAVRGAIEEVENALAAVRRDARSIDGATSVVSIAQQTLDAAQKIYEAGQGDIRDVLNAERTLVDARGQLASATQQYARNYVTLNVAIGGGLGAL